MMRRKDRQMPADFAYHVADKCEYAVLSMTDTKGFPYCIPVTIARDNSKLYFHSAKEGNKIECLKNDNRVCLVCVGDTLRIPDKFTTEFESAIIRGTASEVLEDEEKVHALKLICQRHAPSNMHEFDNAIQKSLSRTAIWKIEILTITGKRKRYDRDGKEMKFGRME